MYFLLLMNPCHLSRNICIIYTALPFMAIGVIFQVVAWCTIRMTDQSELFIFFQFLFKFLMFFIAIYFTTPYYVSYSNRTNLAKLLLLVLAVEFPLEEALCGVHFSWSCNRKKAFSVFTDWFYAFISVLWGSSPGAKVLIFSGPGFVG